MKKNNHGQRQRNSSKSWIRKVDFVFYNEEEIRLSVLEARNTAASAPVIRNASGISDPTAWDAIYNLTPLPTITISGQALTLPERWLTVIDKTYAWAQKQSPTGLHYEVARRRYSGEDYRVTCRELSISPPYLYKIMDNIKMYASLQAAQMNLIFIE